MAAITSRALVLVFFLAIFVFLSGVSHARFVTAPESHIPYGFTVATVDLDGSIGSFALDPSNHSGVPLVVHAFLEEDATLRYMWSPENGESVAAFLEDAPNDTHFLFISYGLNATGDMRKMQARFTEVLRDQGLSSQDIAAKLKNFHFTRDPMSGVSDQGANFIPYLLSEWQASRRLIRIHRGKGLHTVERLDSVFDWIPKAAPTTPLPLVAFGDGCNDVLPLDAQGGVALVLRTRQECSFAEIISRAQASNASAVLVSAVEGNDVVPMNCQGKQCKLALHTFASMIPYAAAKELSSAGAGITVEFGEEMGPGYYAAVDGAGRLQEVGWVKFPSLQHLSWAAQWLEYRQGLSRRLEEDKDTLVVPIFEDEVMQGEHGIVKDVTLPPLTELRRYQKLELDFELGCPGVLDADCPIWDHVVQLFVCCGEECEPCDVTPWLHRHHPDDPSEVEWQQRWRSQKRSSALEGTCGRELGRWVTPFRRRVGRWLTDVTPLAGLISSSSCRFTAQTAPWALPWKPSLSLRYSQPAPASRPGYSVLSTVPLFDGKTFDASYNKDRPERTAVTPHGTVQALLYAMVTGHGSDEFNCTEFCPTSHHFSINGEEVVLNFTEAGTQWGCTKHVLDGVEPNEHGTWQYGRGGWCDGQEVAPHVFDVTDLVSYAGRTSQVGYHGLFRGRDPNPQQSPGYIMMQSSLVFIGNNLTSGPAS